MYSKKYIIWNPPKFLTFILNDSYKIPIEKLVSNRPINSYYQPLNFNYTNTRKFY
jgi:hypothetical protein